MRTWARGGGRRRGAVVCGAPAPVSPASATAVTSRQKLRLVLFAVLLLFVGFALSDVLGLRPSHTGVVGPEGYTAISHGSHSHYVPNGWTGDPPLSNFPQAPPPPGMTIGPTGEIVPVGE